MYVCRYVHVRLSSAIPKACRKPEVARLTCFKNIHQSIPPLERHKLFFVYNELSVDTTSMAELEQTRYSSFFYS